MMAGYGSSCVRLAVLTLVLTACASRYPASVARNTCDVAPQAPLVYAVKGVAAGARIALFGADCGRSECRIVAGDTVVPMLRRPMIACLAAADLPASVFGDYRVTVDGRQIAQGVLANPVTDTFRFAVVGDSRNIDQQPQTLVSRAVAASKPDFVLHLGDIARKGEYLDDWRLYLQIWGIPSLNAPIAPTIGNHDVTPARLFTWFALADTPTLRPHRYYTFDHGNSRFIVLDSSINVRPHDEQTRFLRAALTAPRTGIDHIFVAVHHPPFSSGPHGDHERLIRAWHPLFAKSGVRAVWAGHDHHYERLVPQDGVAYFVSGGAGSPLRAIDPDERVAASAVAYHYMIVDVEGPHVYASAINHLGTTIDSVKITR